MNFQTRMSFRLLAVATVAFAFCPAEILLAQTESSNRRTPLVKAVANARPAVVNLRGKKTIRSTPGKTGTPTQAVRQVNGMGTGVIIDPSGYILTNFHVVEDVKRIHVTLSDHSSTIGLSLIHI